MILMCVDTSGPSASLALVRDGELIYEAALVNKLTHSVNLMPMAEEALRSSGLEMKDIGLFAAVAGPGSFTGVRIGVAAVQGMAQGLNKLCLPVNALEALAFGLLSDEYIVCPIRDARAGQVYGAAFRTGRRLMEDAVLKLPEYLEEIKPLGERFVFTGDGVPVSREKIMEALGERAVFAPPHLSLLKAGAAAMIAWNTRDQAVQPQELLPLYLRRPQAEREREARNG